MLTPSRSLPPLLLLGLFACKGSQPGPVDRSSYAELLQSRDLALLAALDDIEDHRELAAAPWLLWIERNPGRNLPERSRAAAALSRLGFSEGQDFCLAILGAWLPGHETESQQFGIPRSERMAFAREIAGLALQDRLQQAGREVPDYDVNQGAPQMNRSVAALQQALSKLPPRRPVAGPRSGGPSHLYPADPPAEWTQGAESWAKLRDECDRAFAGKESSPARAQRR